ncbi:unnamed protein product, partial [Durusdinium trenchii]
YTTSGATGVRAGPFARWKTLPTCKAGRVSVNSPKFHAFLKKPLGETGAPVLAICEDNSLPLKMPEKLEPPGMSPLGKAAWDGSLDTCRTLLAEKADLEAKDAAGRSVLSLAAASGRREVVRLLLEQCLGDDAADRGGLTALHWAAKEGKISEVQDLLDANANLNAADEEGMTAVKLAAIFNRVEVLRCLVDRGADAQEPLELAKKLPRSAEAARFLQSVVT